MKRLYFSLFLCGLFLFSSAKTSGPINDLAPGVKEKQSLTTSLTTSTGKTKSGLVPANFAGWDVAFAFSSQAAANPGIETDGTNFYTTTWNSDVFYKFSMAGDFIESFSIGGVSSIRDMAYDGQYFYGSPANNTIYIMDLANKTLIGTITTTVSSVRHISYDPTLDSGNGGFWVGGWSDIYSIDKSGNIIGTSTATANCYGSAYDNYTAGGPYLWLYLQSGSTSLELHQFNIATRTFTGVVYETTYDGTGTTVSGMAGGACSYYGADGVFYLVVDAQLDPNRIIVYTPSADPNGTAAAQLFEVTNENCTLNAKIKWQAPDTTINGNTLTKVDSLKLFINDSLINIITNPEVGSLDSINYTFQSFGYYKISIIFYNDSLKGLTLNLFKNIGASKAAQAQNVDMQLANCSTEGKIKFQAPFFDINASDLCGLDSLKVWINSELAFTKNNPTIGGLDSLNYNFNNDINTIEIVYYNNGLTGNSFVRSSWYGPDKPQQLNYIIDSLNNSNPYFAWSPVNELGENGLSICEFSSYKITRYPDGAVFFTNDTNFLDNTGVFTTVYYSVQALNAYNVEGSAINTNTFIFNQVNITQNDTVTTCFSNFFDSGGFNGSYGNGENHTITFMPAEVGNKLTAIFNSITTESGWDYFYVYDSAAVDASKLIATFSGSFSDTSFTATNSDGALTFVFTSDGSVVRDGWDAIITCDPDNLPKTSKIVYVTNKDGEPVVDAKVTIFDNIVNYTDTAGIARITLASNTAQAIFNAEESCVANLNTTLDFTVNDSLSVKMANPLLTVSLGSDVTIYSNESVTLEPNKAFDFYEWSTSDNNATLELPGNDLGLGNHSIWIEVSNENGCTARDTIIITVNEFIDDAVKNNTLSETISLYPNPTTDRLYVNYSGTDKINVKVYTLTGQLSIDEYVESNGYINLKNLVNGLYVVQLNYKGSVSETKIIKE
jgi:hypothetical protein